MKRNRRNNFFSRCDEKICKWTEDV